MTAVSTQLTIKGWNWERLARLREAFDLISAIREIRNPFATPEEFRKLIAYMLRLAEQFGVDQAWLDRWESLLKDDRLLQIVLAIGRYVLGILNRDSGETRTTSHEVQAVVVDAQAYSEWLPMIIELLRLILRLRGGE